MPCGCEGLPRRSRAAAKAGRQVGHGVGEPTPVLDSFGYCKRIRNDQNYWERVEVYVTDHTDAKFTHGICPTCLEAAKAEFAREDPLTESPRGR